MLVVDWKEENSVDSDEWLESLQRRCPLVGSTCNNFDAQVKYMIEVDGIHKK